MQDLQAGKLSLTPTVELLRMAVEHFQEKTQLKVIEAAIPRVMDLTPRGIRIHLGLNKPIYERTAAYGHFGREPDNDGGFSWERTDLATAISTAL